MTQPVFANKKVVLVFQDTVGKVATSTLNVLVTVQITEFANKQGLANAKKASEALIVL